MAENRIIHFCLLFSFIWISLGAKIRNDDEYRLSSTRIPHHYQLDITVEETTFHGRAMISYTSAEKSKYLYLHASPKTLMLTKIVSDFVTSCNLNSTNSDTEIITIECAEIIKEGNHTIIIDYIGIYPVEEFVGLYRTYYGLNKDWYVSTQFEPTYARRVFPCFDEPGFKAKFDVIIRSPEGFNALANTPKVNQTYTTDG